MPLPKPPAKRAACCSRRPTSNPRPRRNAGQARAAPGPRPSRAGRRRCSSLNDAGCRPAPPPTRAGAAVAQAPRPAPPPAADAPRPSARARPRGNGPATLFVLDTNVLMHDPTSLFRFEEHDIYLPMITLEELDGHKSGMTEVARNARQVSRDLDALAANMPTRNADGRATASPLNKHRPPRGRRQAVLPDQPARRHAAGRPAAGQGRQPDPRRRARRCASSSRSATSCWCPRTSTCASRRARWACRPRTTSTTRRSRTATCSTPACCRCRPTSGSARQDDGELAAGRPHLLPHHRAAGAGAADQPVRLPRGAGRRAALRQGHRDHRQDRGAADAARTTPTRRTRSGA